MAPFRFRLARVLSWYGKQCDLEESRLHVRAAAVLETAGQIARLQAARAALENEMIRSAAPRPPDLTALELYRDRSKRDEVLLQKEFLQRQRALAEQRAVLEAARRRFRLLEKLRERRLSEHVYEADKELEELAADAFRAASFRQNHIS
jgi:hypothetical protein